MKKRISFFDFSYSFIVRIALIIIMVIMSIIIVSFSYFNHQNEEIRYIDDIKVYKFEEVETFNAYIREDGVFLVVFFKAYKEDSFLLDYAFYYHNQYQKAIYLEADINLEIKYVTITLEGIAAIN